MDAMHLRSVWRMYLEDWQLRMSNLLLKIPSKMKKKDNRLFGVAWWCDCPDCTSKARFSEEVERNTGQKSWTSMAFDELEQPGEIRNKNIHKKGRLSIVSRGEKHSEV